MLQYPSPIAHHRARAAAGIIAAAVVALVAWPRPQVITTPVLLAPPATVRTAQAPPMTPSAPPAPSVTPAIPSGTTYLSGELSLQQTLDRLGYTVNVPNSYAGHPVYQWNSDRVSDRSDAVAADQFNADGDTSFAIVSEQSYFGSRSAFTARSAGGTSVTLPPTGQPGLWLTPDRGGARFAMSGPLEFSIQHPGDAAFGSDTDRPLYSNAQKNPDGGSQLLVLPAKAGGSWVSDGSGLGHWQGAHNTGVYLLCWEDTPNGDHDYQDIVIATHGLQPAQ